MSETVTIPARFNGPLESGNGGYSAGAFARFLDGPVEVSLRRPVPLDAEIEIVRDGPDALEARRADELIAEATAVPEFALEVSDQVTLDEARAAVDRFRGNATGQFSRCFVCGEGREDTFGVFAGRVEGRALVASPWTPPRWTGGDDRSVRAEFLWAVLDCPTYQALYMDGELPVSVLGRITARIDGQVEPGREHVVIGWPIERDGRKHHAGSAVLSSGGEVLAVARAVLIAPRDFV